MALPMNRGFQKTYGSMTPRDQAAYGKIKAAATPGAARELDRDLRKMGQTHGLDRRLNEEGELDDSQAMTPPGMGQAFKNRKPWAPGQTGGGVRIQPYPMPGDAQVQGAPSGTIGKLGGFMGNALNGLRPTATPQAGFTPWPQLGGRGVDRMFVPGRNGPAPEGFDDMIPALPPRSQTSSPGIGLDGKRINYSR